MLSVKSCIFGVCFSECQGIIVGFLLLAVVGTQFILFTVFFCGFIDLYRLHFYTFYCCSFSLSVRYCGLKRHVCKIGFNFCG